MDKTGASSKAEFFILKHKVFFRITLNILLIAIASFLTIRYNYLIEKEPVVDTSYFKFAYAFKCVPIMIVSALSGVASGIICALLVFVFNTVTASSFAFMSSIYLIVTIAVFEMSKCKWFRSKFKTILGIILIAFINGALWGGLLGVIAGRGLLEFVPYKMFFYTLDELLESSITMIFLYLFLNFTPDYVKELFYTAQLYSTRIEANPNLDEFRYTRHSKLGIVVTNIIVFQAALLGILAALFSNTLIPSMHATQAAMEAGELEVDYLGDEEWKSITNAVVLEKKVSELVALSSDEIDFNLNNATLAYDTKLMMLIMMLIIPSAVFINKYATWRIVRPIDGMSNVVRSFAKSQGEDLQMDLDLVHELNITTGDEIEDLYNAFRITVTTTVGYINYIKMQHNLEEDLEIAKEANKAKSRFLSNMSHEIRTPINAVLGFDEMIIRESTTPSITEYAREIQNAGKTLLSLINDILDFSKIESGKMEIIPVEYELSSVLNDIANMINVRAREKDIELIYNVDENIPHILIGDEMRIRQCVLNILTNAVKYTPSGTITTNIGFEKAGNNHINLTFQVIDTGQGIKEEDLEKLFSAFERIDETKNKTIEGTGLGMNIVKTLLDLMGSELVVRSEYGVGSDFSFAVRQKVVSWEPVGSFSQIYKDALSKLEVYEESFHAPDATILVVDDTRANLTVVKGLLKETGIVVDTAESGLKAIEMVKEKKYDVIFLDHRMPEMDGIETFHEMQKLTDTYNKNTPVIALTANAISGAREEYFKEGFTDYLSKPVDSSRLEELLLTYIPKEKVSKKGDADYVTDARKEESREAEAKAYAKVVNVTGIDMQVAINNCGSAELLYEVLSDFWLTIEDKSLKIEEFAQNKDIKNYTILVHGLKSSARTIGAMKLSEMAAYLEQCGNNKKIEEIEEKTPVLLENYRSYKEHIAPAMEVASADNGKPEISKEELESAFAGMREFVEASYFDSVDDIMKMLNDYSIPSEYKDKYKKVKKLLAAVDRDGLLKIL
ncbi:MAG: response regulator [Butyrivibrio sp.]|nr:response regulator [Butyrivibrio sp.]